jgi:hypothetical protein
VKASDVAAWMMEEVERVGTLYQDCAVDEIERRFGEEFVYSNENGNPAIRKMSWTLSEIFPNIRWSGNAGSAVGVCGRKWMNRDVNNTEMVPVRRRTALLMRL